MLCLRSCPKIGKPFRNRPLPDPRTPPRTKTPVNTITAFPLGREPSQPSKKAKTTRLARRPCSRVPATAAGFCRRLLWGTAKGLSWPAARPSRAEVRPGRADKCGEQITTELAVRS